MELKLYSVVRGKVVSIKEFGAFISIEGSDKQGLLHRSQISNHPIEDIAEVLEIGEQIYCKIISEENGKIGLSMKLVSQTSGEDKDPNNLIVAQMEKRRKGGKFRAPSPIRLEAELNTCCSRCKGKGHIASTCFVPLGDSALELLASDSDSSPEKKMKTNANDVESSCRKKHEHSSGHKKHRKKSEHRTHGHHSKKQKHEETKRKKRQHKGKGSKD